MSTSSVKLATPQGYQALSPKTLCIYLETTPIAHRLGGTSSQWSASEVGDGNLNLVFIVEGPKGSVVVKQALPYVRMVGESWPLPLARAHFEHLALVEQGKHAPQRVPAIYHYDAPMALTVMEYLTPHIILRKGLIAGERYPHMAAHVGEFLAHSLFFTSDFYLDPVSKREKIALYLTNTAMCKISEDLIFDEPYFDAELNRHTSPQLDDIALEFRKDTVLKLAVQELKYKFMNNAESLLHGDLHTGSVMVTEDDTRAIDPEFAFYGPMGFDVGAFIANLLMAYFSKDKNDDYALWILEQTQILWQSFSTEFSSLWAARKGGEIFNPRLYDDAPDLKEAALQLRLDTIFGDALGFAGCKIIRRILGLAHVDDFESIEDADKRAACERRALLFARRLILERKNFKTMQDVLKAAQ